jgi:hypothetical protein
MNSILSFQRCRTASFVAACVAMLLSGISARGEKITDTAVAFLGRRLDSAATGDERLVVLLEIRKHAASSAMPSLLEPIAKHADDADAGVRCAAVLVLAQIAFEHKTKCPSELVSALIDREPEVRRAASENILPEEYASIPANALEVGRTVLNSDRYRAQRATTITLLRYCDRDKRSVDRLIVRGLSDRDFLVRNNAAAAMISRGHRLSSALTFFVEAAFGEIEREFYSAKVGWDDITAEDELAAFHSMHIALLKKAAQEHPFDVLTALSKRLDAENQKAVATALESARSLPIGGEGLETNSRWRDLEAQLAMLKRDSNSEAAELAGIAIRQLFEPKVDAK